MTNRLYSFEDSGHVAVKHEPMCDNPSCMFCVGGLFACTRCGSFEGATTMHCPGVEMTEEQRDLVYKADLDFRDGEWIRAAVSPYCPMGTRVTMEAFRLLKRCGFSHLLTIHRNTVPGTNRTIIELSGSLEPKQIETMSNLLSDYREYYKEDFA